jgi:hypothetical protein
MSCVGRNKDMKNTERGTNADSLIEADPNRCDIQTYDVTYFKNKKDN